MMAEDVLLSPPDQCYEPTLWLKYFYRRETIAHGEQRFLCQLFECDGMPDAWVVVPEEEVE